MGVFLFLCLIAWGITPNFAAQKAQAKATAHTHNLQGKKPSSAIKSPVKKTPVNSSAVVKTDKGLEKISVALPPKLQALKKKLKDPGFLKTRKPGDKFYLPLQYLRPGILTFPFKTVERVLSAKNGGVPVLPKTLDFDDGKATRNLAQAFKIILTPNHEFSVVTGNYVELFIDILAGAQTIPVVVGHDYSNFFDERRFWVKAQKENLVCLFDIHGTFHYPEKTLDAIEDSPIIANLDVLIPYIRIFKDPPKARVDVYVDTPAGIRLQKNETPFLIDRLSRAFQEAITQDDYYGWKDDKDLQALFENDASIPSPEVIDKVRQVLHEAYRDNRLEGWDGFFSLGSSLKFDEINLQDLTGYNEQIVDTKRYSLKEKSSTKKQDKTKKN